MPLIDDYLARTPRSRELFERATGSLPGGSTRTTVYTAPYPPYVESGAGLRIRDVDGNVYRDFLGNYTSLILGHAHPAVVAAVEAQVRRGSAFAAPTETEVELAEEIRRRVPSIERLRFTSSGTEATMFAIRAARAFTGRPLIARFDHSYHGTHDGVMIGTAGVPEVMSGLVVELPWGEPGRDRSRPARPRTRARGDHHRAGPGRRRRPCARTRVSCRFLRALTERHGALLIFDEIISFRVAPGGAQERFGVRPDLTTLGKIIGGGYPLAAFGGRADVMDDLRRPALRRGQPRRHVQRQSGRRRGRSRHASRADARRLRAAGRPRRAARATASRPRSRATASTPESPSSGRSSRSSRATGRVRRSRPASPSGPTLFLGLLLEGFYLAPRGMGAIPTIATEADIDDLAAAIGRALAALRPVAETAGA